MSKVMMAAIAVLGLVFTQNSFSGPDKSMLSKRPSVARQAYFGDLHVHTRNSFDAYIFGVRNTPDDAYRFGKGETITHVDGTNIRLHGQPLDFMAVTDHGEYLGVIPGMDDADSPLSKLPLARLLNGGDIDVARRAFMEVGTSIANGSRLLELNSEDSERSTWLQTIEASEAHNNPGRFTTFSAYEFTSVPEANTLHRNVIFADTKVPNEPFTALNSRDPEDLWHWLDAQRAAGVDALAIPHNTNISDGLAFGEYRFNGESMTAEYAELRKRNEPLVEITQIKGSSETHPMLSPNDDWAEFEIFEIKTGGQGIISKTSGGYVREAYRVGLQMGKDRGYNPYRFGVIGSTDSHNGAGPVEESSYFGKIGIADSSAERRKSLIRTNSNLSNMTPSELPTPPRWSASGLAGVWAEENSRAAIFSALRRKETFATSGPRIKVRFFGGFNLGAKLEGKRDLVSIAYKKGVPMGAELVEAGSKPLDFLVWALRDPNSGLLQRAQIVKGWTEAGVTKERVFDVACAGGREPDSTTHRCPDRQAIVNLSTCEVSVEQGAGELRTIWRDPSFDPAERAFYYVRVLEEPSCRWSTWDAIRAGVEPHGLTPLTIQERAWTSPIWYLPSTQAM